MLELSYFQASCILIGQTKVDQRGCDPGIKFNNKGAKNMKNERSFEKMNADLAKRCVFPE